MNERCPETWSGLYINVVAKITMRNKALHFAVSVATSSRIKNQRITLEENPSRCFGFDKSFRRIDDIFLNQSINHSTTEVGFYYHRIGNLFHCIFLQNTQTLHF